MRRYAAQTTVAPEKSRAEIERVLARYGATRFAYANDGRQAMIGFQVNGRQVRFLLQLPDLTDKAFAPKRARYRESSEQYRAKLHERAIRQCWRALTLCIKAKLEAVAAKIVTFDEEFLAQLILPGGKTFGQTYIPQIESAMKGKELPPLLGM